MSSMMTDRKARIALCGLIFMVSFLYLNAFLFVSVQSPDRENQYADRNIPDFWKAAGISLHRSLLCLTPPAWIVARKMYEPYYGELVYYPFMGGIIWFSYGCLLAWAHYAKRLKIVLLILVILWALLLYLYWVEQIWW